MQFSRFEMLFGLVLWLVAALIGISWLLPNATTDAGGSTKRLGPLTVDGRRLPMTWQRVSRDGLGEDWPLKVDSALVGCSLSFPMFSVLIVVDGEPWAFNGSTKGAARGDRYRLDVDGGPRAVRVADDPEPWWEPHPDGGRKNIKPLLDVAERTGCLGH